MSRRSRQDERIVALNVLVTGGGGFLGRYIVEQLLARGDRVRSFSRQSYSFLEELGVESVVGDVRDAAAVAAACDGMQAVVHTIGIAGIWGPWKKYHGVNTVGTEHVIAACQQHGVSRLVYSSSPSVTFDGCDQEGVDESAAYAERWLCHYPHSKALAEQAVLQADDETGLRTCALRPHLIWGPRDQHLIPRLLKRAEQGRLRQVGKGENLIDMIYVENAARAHLLAIDALAGRAPAAGKAYFISQGEPVNCWDWINEILELAGLPPVKRKLSRRFAWCIGSLMEAVYWFARLRSEPAMTRFLAAQLSTSHYFDMTRARVDLGYDAQISTAEGMGRLKQCFADQGPAKMVL